MALAKYSASARVILALLFSLSLVLLTYGITKWKYESSRAEQANFRLQQNLQKSADTSLAPLKTISIPAKTSESTAGGERRNPQDIAVVDSWFKQVGFSTEAERAYDQQYTDAQLKGMADRGDMTAIDTLISRYIRRGESELILPMAEKGIIHGSLNSIEAAMQHFGIAPSTEDSLELRQINKERLKQFLVYAELMKLRGAADLYITPRLANLKIESYKEKYKEVEPLTAEDYELITKRSRELYDHYQAERNKLGLGDFNNTMPKEVAQFLGK